MAHLAMTVGRPPNVDPAKCDDRKGAQTWRPGSEPSLGRTPATTESWWKLVWCHPNCHKPQLDHQRRVLTTAAESAGAAVVCLKKAQRFQEWVSHRQRPPFVLVTNRREVGICLEASREQPSMNRPAFTIIVCEGGRFQPANPSWALQLGTIGGPVLVHRSMEDISASLPELAGSLRARLKDIKLMSWFGSRDAETRGPSQASRQLAKPCERKTAPYEGAPCSRGAAQEEKHVSTRSVSTETTSSTASSSGLDEWWPAWPPPVAKVLAPICKAHSCAEIEQILLEAMPDHYDD
mmetsp:Transcript_23773/g.68618  ORF Transcript_23773/g.68618 Transcript_23773/m.68618 type:complete len:293 (+) Transcript_23773:63-941(+)